MTFNGTHHNFVRSFIGQGARDYNVSCTHADYTNLTTQDSFTISMNAIPEFNLLTLVGGLAIVALGLVIARKRR